MYIAGLVRAHAEAASGGEAGAAHSAPSSAAEATGIDGSTRAVTADVARKAPVHPAWLRITHWINAVAVVVLIASGWRIYNASPLFDFRIPNELTLGGWLAGALQWHFAAMWLLALNGLVYLLLNLATGRVRRKFWPLSASAVWQDFIGALRGRLSHADPTRYNAVQKLAYLCIWIDLALLVASGLVLWKSVQFPLLRTLLGGYEAARYVHFFSMAFLVAFVALHLAMVALVPKTLVAMIRGR